MTLLKDLRLALAVVVGCVFVGAPAGLLWSWVAPRYGVDVDAQGGLHTPDILSTRAFIGADVSYVAVVFGAGVLCGIVAWFVARRGGPWTVGALALGGVLAALVAARVGVLPGSDAAIQALRRPGAMTHGHVTLFLGVLDRNASQPHIRAAWGALAWPVGALVAFMTAAWWRPHELD